MTDEQLAIEIPGAGEQATTSGPGSAPLPSVIPSHDETAVVFKLAQNLARTTFVPEAYQGKPDEIAACMLYSRAIGIDPMIGLQEINVVKGRPTPSAQLQAATIRRAGHRIDVIDWTDTEAKLRGVRFDKGGESTVDVSFSLEDAKRAGLIRQGSSWTTYPRAMVMARAISALARALFSDLVLGMEYTSEEMGAEPHPADLLE